jgi:hypothetical protein
MKDIWEFSFEGRKNIYQLNSDGVLVGYFDHEGEPLADSPALQDLIENEAGGLCVGVEYFNFEKMKHSTLENLAASSPAVSILS